MKISHHSLATMKKKILLSHERSKQYELNPYNLQAPEHLKLSKLDLKKRIETQKLLYDLVKEQIDMLYAILQDSGFAISLADNEGYILYVVGDTDILTHFNKRNYVEGYRWLEKDMGTCAIGLSLYDQAPIYIEGGQMFSVYAMHISNAASPIFGLNKEILGVICISGHSRRMHIHTLALVCQAAETVGFHLKEHKHSHDLAIKNEYMQALIEAGTKGTVTVDCTGKIVQTNNKACVLLKLPKNHIQKDFKDFVNMDFNLIEVLQSGTGFLMHEIGLANEKTGKAEKKTKYFLALAPVILQSGEMVGAVLSITEKKEMVKLAMKLAGTEAHFTFQSIVGRSRALNQAIDMARIAANNDAPVLILGATGTGKELFAQAIHNASNRCDNPFIALNCGAIPRELLESELFGYDEGAFTGAQKGGRAGKFEIADTGTLFLDEIGDMPFDMQVKLLRALQTGEIQRVGGHKTIKVDMRIISATNKDLHDESLFEQFRPDLYYRISTLFIKVPSLQERKDDLPLLINFFMKRHGLQSDHISADAQKFLLKYHWPGNVRQLENTLERAIHIAQGAVLQKEHFGLVEAGKSANTFVERTLDATEEEAIRLSLKQTATLSACAKSLGISRPTLYRKLAKYGIEYE